MKTTQVILCERLQQLGFKHGYQMKLYGKVFELLSEPIVMGDNLVFVDATDMKSGRLRRVRIPVPIVNMASASSRAA